MQLTCEQHIFTDRLNTYATVAESPGIDAALRRELEPWVRPAPGTDWMVVRCSPIQDGTWMAVSFSARRTRARGAHIAHTYLIATEKLADVGWNLLWLALPLRFWEDYRPAPTSIDKLQPTLVDLDPDADPAERLGMLRWLCAISEPGAVANWQGGLLAALAAGEPVRLSFGPARNLADATEKLEKLLQAPVPASADALTLWRAAGLLCLIPGSFQRGLSICINDSSRTDAMLVIEPEGDTPSRFEQTAAPAYLDHCYALLERGADDELVDFLKDVDINLDTPSVLDLDATTDYLKTRKDSHQLQSRIKRLRKFWRSVATVPQASVEEALSLLNEADLGSIPASRLIADTASHALSPRFQGTLIPGQMLDLLLRWQAPPGQQHDLLSGLPFEAKRNLWTLCGQRGQSPAWLRTGTSLEQEVLWADALFAELPPPQQSAAVDAIVGLLLDAGRLPGGFSVARAIERLIELGDRLDPSARGLCLPLVQRFAEKIDSSDRYSAERALGKIPDLVERATQTVPETAIGANPRLIVAGRLGAALAHRCRDSDFRRKQAIDYVLTPPQPNRRDVEIHRRLCQAVARTEGWQLDPDLCKLARVQCELLSLLLGPPRLEALGSVPDCVRIVLPEYLAWVEAKGRTQEIDYETFHTNLRQIVNGLATPDAFCIAVSYLHADREDAAPTNYLLEDLVWRVWGRACDKFDYWFVYKQDIWDQDRYQSDEHGRSASTGYRGPNFRPPWFAGVYQHVSPLAMFALFYALIERRKKKRTEQTRIFAQKGLARTKCLIDRNRWQDLADCLDAAGRSRFRLF